MCRNSIYHFVALIMVGYITVSCNIYDDSDIYSKYNSLEARVDKLETVCESINQDITTLRKIVNALEKNDGIVSVDEIYEGGEVLGYKITLGSGESFTIYNGKQGEPGENAGKVPEIGIRQDSDGNWYWTLNGEWMIDEEGNRVIASGRNGSDGLNGENGTNGKDGEDGVDGKDGITPILKIVDGYWQVSYDNGKTWTTLGRAVGEDGADGNDGANGTDGQSSIFIGVDKSNQDYVIITLSDGSFISVPYYKPLQLILDGAEGVTVVLNSQRIIDYIIEGASQDVQIETITEGVKAKVNRTDYSSGNITVSIGEEIEEDAKVLVFVVDNGTTIMRKLTFENCVIAVNESTAKEIAYTGGEFVIDMTTNADIEIIIPSEASSWVSIPPETKALRDVQKTVLIAENKGQSRSVTLTVKDKSTSVSAEVTLLQHSHPYYYESTDFSMNGQWKKLQSASIDDQGINVVFLGDAYTDALINDGTYDRDMKRAMEHFFGVEPFTSMRDMFNCYQVYAVSKNNNYNEGSSTVFQCQFGNGTHITGFSNKVRMYAQKVTEIKKENIRFFTQIEGEEYVSYRTIHGGILCVVVLNSHRYAGTCSIEIGGISVAYCPLNTDDEEFGQTIHHEACGHGFAYLADEYGGYESLSESYADDLALWQGYGIYQNVDTTNNPNDIIWSKFLQDSRYTSETGIFEGGYYCNTGVWRPSENSIMRYNTGGFNAPSRELIYKRAMELSKESSYIYDFEDFVAFDETIRNKQSTSQRAFASTLSTKPFTPLGVPEIVIEQSYNF